MKKGTFENPYKAYLDMEEYTITHDEYPCEYCRQNLKSKLWGCTLVDLEHGVSILVGLKKRMYAVWQWMRGIASSADSCCSRK